MEKNRMKKVAWFGLALGLALCGCDDTSSGSREDLYSCDTRSAYVLGVATFVSHACVETPASEATQSFAASCPAMEVPMLTMAPGEGCENGAVLECTKESDGVVYTTHYYDDSYAQLSCDQVDRVKLP